MKALVLADKYAHAMAAYRLESLYGTSESYTLKKADECDEAFDALATELRRLAAVEAELERIKALEPVAWRTFDGEGDYDYRTYDMNERYAEDYAKRNPNHANWVEPLYALGSKTNG